MVMAVTSFTIQIAYGHDIGHKQKTAVVIFFIDEEAWKDVFELETRMFYRHGVCDFAYRIHFNVSMLQV
jgi:hypothetical protein